MQHKDFYKLSEIYLKSNACGMWDGSLKADTHEKLCVLFISKRLNITTEQAKKIKYLDDRLSSLVRKSTLQLTDNLDKEIDFPLEAAPNYKKLTPKFAVKFLNFASGWFDDNPCLMSDELLIITLTNITQKKLAFSYPALTSYGFDFINGEAGEFLTMESKLGQVATIKPNEFFGCNFKIEKSLKDKS